MKQETPFGLFYVGLPEELIKSLREISERKGQSLVECISEAIYDLEQKHVTGKQK